MIKYGRLLLSNLPQPDEKVKNYFRDSIQVS